jgi:serine/threonine-protein kinase Chk1
VSSVFRAIHFSEQRVAACKMIILTVETKQFDRKMFDKEMRVHSALKHANVLEFLNAVVVEPNVKTSYHPGIYSESLCSVCGTIRL